MIQVAKIFCTIVYKLLKLTFISLILLSLEIFFGIGLCHLDGSDSDSDNSELNRSRKEKRVVSDSDSKDSVSDLDLTQSNSSYKLGSKSEKDLDPNSIGTFRIDLDAFNKASVPRSTFGSSHTLNNRVQGFMTEFLVAEFRDREARCIALGLHIKSYSDMSPAQRVEWDALLRTRDALANSSAEQAKSGINSMIAQNQYAAAQAAEAGTASSSHVAPALPKRELEEAPVEGSSSKKVFSDITFSNQPSPKSDHSESEDSDSDSS